MITNKLNVPESIVNFANAKNGIKGYTDNRYSVTELLNSTQEIHLNREHYQEIDEDVIDYVPALIGTAVHSILELNTTEGKKEYKVEGKLEGCEIVGVIDLLKDNIIYDYKTITTSKNDFEEWRLQGLAYAWILYYFYDTKITDLNFIGLYKDWSKIKAYSNPSYPQSPIYVWEYSLTDNDLVFIEEYMRDKIKALKSGEFTCKDNECWKGKDTYAVYKNATDLKATKIYDSEFEAQGYIDNKLKGVGIIVKREGERVKCKYYCKVKEWCKLYVYD